MTAPHGLDEVRAFYGDLKIERSELGGWKIISPIGWESANCVVVTLDEIDGRRLYVNRKIVEPLQEALRLSKSRCPDYAIRTIGCFNPRPKRVVGAPPGVVGWANGLSIHTAAAAVDINASSNPMRSPLTTDMPEEFISAWQEIGWTWGGTFPTPDSMHFQWASGL